MRGRTKSSIIETVSAPKIRAWESLDERTQKLIAPSPVHIQRAVPQPAMMLKEREVFLEEPGERFWVGRHDASFSARMARSRG
jgi:hypothetical protein